MLSKKLPILILSIIIHHKIVSLKTPLTITLRDANNILNSGSQQQFSLNFHLNATQDIEKDTNIQNDVQVPFSLHSALFLLRLREIYKVPQYTRNHRINSVGYETFVTFSPTCKRYYN